MSTERETRIAELVAALRPLGEAERSQRLEPLSDDPGLIAAVRERLDSERRHSETESTEGHAVDRLIDPSGARIGGYRIGRRLGRGGMGAVYVAEQGNPRRQVALKLLHGDTHPEELLLRFAREAQVLGRLRHPGIAQIIEAGRADLVWDGGSLPDQPFIAMELIEGKTLIDHARDGALSNRQRLELFVTICSAVQHAHQHGVIHRDLKPANILVTPEGEPKVLDFGIARLESNETRDLTLETELGRLVGTLAYMSPEQVRGDSSQLDTRTDVYSLGVVLYELLTGKLPFPVSGMPVPLILREIQEKRPVSIGHHQPELRGDVSTIVDKALEKEPERRYSSAAELGEDIRRALDDEPITARKPSGVYLLRKFARRNRVMVASAAVALLGLVLGPTYGLLRAQADRDLAVQAKDQAEDELETALVVTDFLVDTLKSAKPHEKGAEVTVRQVLDAAEPSLEARFRNRPLVEARLREAIGSTYRELAEPGVARTYLERARDLYDQEYGPGSLSALRARFDLARVTFDEGDREGGFAQLEELMKEALEIGVSQDLYREMELQRASDLRVFDRFDESEKIYRRLLAERTREVGEKDPAVAAIRRQLGSLLANSGNFEEGLPMLERSVADLADYYGESHANTSRALYALAVTQRVMGKHDEAIENLLEIVATHQRLYGDRHQVTARSRLALADVYHELGRWPEAEELAQEALSTFESIAGPDHQFVGEALRELGVFQFSQGKYDDARKTQERALAIYRSTSGVTRRQLAVLLSDLGLTFARSGDLDRAAPLQLEGFEEAEVAFGETHPTTMTLLENLASTIFRQKDYGRAAEMLERVLAGRIASLGEDHPAISRTIFNTAAVSRGAGQLERAAELFEEAFERFRSELGDEHPNVMSALESMIAVARSLGRAEDELEGLRLRIELLEAKHGEGSPEVMASRADLAKAHERSSDLTEAIAIWQIIHEGASQHLGADSRWADESRKELTRLKGSGSEADR
ncbi:MAG: tetratricopeptide repeat protein [Planctomycetota bacterium]